MTTNTRVSRRRVLSQQDKPTPYPLPCWNVLEKEVHHPKKKVSAEKKDWEDAICSVCLEFPHNAVLLLCSSYDKGCRPYMCATSHRYSNCLDQFEKAYAKLISDGENLVTAGSEKSELMELAACPLCRGQVKGWTVVEPARNYLNAKKRSCMQDNCSFSGTYKQLRKHVRKEHPCARPRKVDPALEQKWKRLENERERDDVMSTIRSSMPGAMVFGDYVIENGNYDDFESDGIDDEGYGGLDMGIDELNDMLLFFHSLGSGRNRSLNSRISRRRGNLRGSIGVRNPPSVAAAAAGGAEIATSDSASEDEFLAREAGRRRDRVVFLGRPERRRRQRRRTNRS